MEPRPSPAGRLEVSRLILYAVLSFVVSWSLYDLAEWELGWAVWSGVGVWLIVFLIDAVFSTGFLHKREEQQTERLRLDAQLAEVEATNQNQTAALEIIWEELARMEERINSMASLKVTSRDGERVIPRDDMVDRLIQRWLTTEIFDQNGQLSGVHIPSMQIKRAVPFKATSKNEDELAAYKRLIAAGLIGQSGNNYTWTGPQRLSMAVDALSKLRGG